MKDLDLLAAELGQKLHSMNVGSRPVIFVAYSFGCLIVRHLMVMCKLQARLGPKRYDEIERRSDDSDASSEEEEEEEEENGKESEKSKKQIGFADEMWGNVRLLVEYGCPPAKKASGGDYIPLMLNLVNINERFSWTSATKQMVKDYERAFVHLASLYRFIDSDINTFSVGESKPGPDKRYTVDFTKFKDHYNHICDGSHEFVCRPKGRTDESYNAVKSALLKTLFATDVLRT
eukprot:TRINITY_DN8709_c0_g1_i1.p1 TRINITY_DN8709_c0_g1~~TRINITY_DN8709_c0_g1_i1.p1  ORF type:complete len:240 (+),score=45.75 TRINITY_DN8709_c0_g1_i1:22-720(+)